MAFSFNGDVRDHLEQMVSDPRFKTLTNLPLFAPMEIGLGLLAYCLFFSGTWLYLEGSINLPVMLLMNSFAIYLSFMSLAQPVACCYCQELPLGFIGTCI